MSGVTIVEASNLISLAVEQTTSLSPVTNESAPPATTTADFLACEQSYELFFQWVVKVSVIPEMVRRAAGLTRVTAENSVYSQAVTRAVRYAATYCHFNMVAEF